MLAVKLQTPTARTILRSSQPRQVQSFIVNIRTFRYKGSVPQRKHHQHRIRPTLTSAVKAKPSPRVSPPSQQIRNNIFPRHRTQSGFIGTPERAQEKIMRERKANGEAVRRVVNLSQSMVARILVKYCPSNFLRSLLKVTKNPSLKSSKKQQCSLSSAPFERHKHRHSHAPSPKLPIPNTIQTQTSLKNQFPHLPK
ncbi:hypothetical protein N431DRAFT_135355 [Stipitochalara longipes BDJ]|nr:hypothetical protein N431DRAFT_135355 [Stipitochalara longipes BDJ]